MKDTNMVILSGRLGNEPTVRAFDSGSSVVNFSLYVNNSYKRNGEWINKTYYLNCQCWNDYMQEKILKLSKGDKVLVEGSITTNKSKDRTYTNIDIRRFQLIEDRSKSEGKKESDQAKPPEDEEELPW